MSFFEPTESVEIATNTTPRSNLSTPIAYWTPEEDRVILEVYRAKGAAWRDMEQALKGRSVNSIRTRYQRMQKNEQRLQSSNPICKSHSYNIAPQWQRVRLALKGCASTSTQHCTENVTPKQQINYDCMAQPPLTHAQPRLASRRPSLKNRTTAKEASAVKNVVQRATSTLSVQSSLQSHCPDKTTTQHSIAQTVQRYQRIRAWYSRHEVEIEQRTASSLWLELVERGALDLLDPTNYYGLRPHLDLEDVEAYLDCQSTDTLVECISLCDHLEQYFDQVTPPCVDLFHQSALNGSLHNPDESSPVCVSS